MVSDVVVRQVGLGPLNLTDQRARFLDVSVRTGSGKTKVADSGLVVAVQKNVGALDIQVEDVIGVEMCKTSGSACEGFQNKFLFQNTR